jgi:hypothetical protein
MPMNLFGPHATLGVEPECQANTIRKIARRTE